MDIPQIYGAIGSIGFPAATCWLVLVKLDSSMKRIEAALIELTKTLARVEKLIDTATAGKAWTDLLTKPE